MTSYTALQASPGEARRWTAVLCLCVLLLAPWSIEVVPDRAVGSSPFRRPSPAAEPVRPVARVDRGVLPAIGVRSLRLGDLAAAPRGPAPERIAIPAIGVDARILPVGVEGGGAMEVPRDAGIVGWYRHGPSPGDRGSAVLAGHVDSRHGPGVFVRLGELRPGALVRVRGADARWRAFEVVWRTLVPKERLPASVFTRHGRSVLSLITCGGGFDAAEGRYTHNVVVAAVPRR